MKTRGTIQILFSVLLLIAVAHTPVNSQDPIPENKKRALHRFDPTDIFPEEREVSRTRGKKKQKNNEANSAAQSTKTRSLETVAPDPPASVAATRRAIAAATPSPTPPVAVQEVEATPSVTPTPEVQASPESQESKATSQQNTIAAVQANLPRSVGGENQTGNGQGLPIYFLVPILLLILFALIAFIVSLKKQLRTP
jgi:ABC-type Na+ efflux pump permease subunit